jgi:hypothetical protein
MTRRFLLATALTIALVGYSSSNVFAQNSPKRTVAVPFTFILEGTNLPAGTYEIQMMDSGMVVLLNTKQTSIEGQAATLPLPLRDTASGSELIFVTSNSGYTLLEIRIDQTRALVTSEYGHPKFEEAQLRTVPITSATSQSGASAHLASSPPAQKP